MNREDFIDLVYSELESDPDNNRANRIIEAANEYAEHATDKNVGTTDTISRQAAIDAIEHRLADPAYQHEGEDWYTGMNCAESELYELPSVQPEQLTDKEQRIFLAAMRRERKVCTYAHEPCEVPLTKVCDEIVRKVKGALWT